jgi:hypothetical protein
MQWYNTERPHHSLNKKSSLQYFCNIINSRKSEFFQTGMTYTIKSEVGFKTNLTLICVLVVDNL